MEESRIVEIKEDILADNTNAANDFRRMLENQGTFFVDVMASPGAGKTTLLLALIEELRKSASIGIIEADLESFVDSRKIKDAGIQAVQLETRGICHVEMSMVERAFQAFGGQHFDYLFLETSATWFARQSSTPVRTNASCCFRFPKGMTRCTSIRPCSR